METGIFQRGLNVVFFAVIDELNIIILGEKCGTKATVFAVFCRLPVPGKIS